MHTITMTGAELLAYKAFQAEQMKKAIAADGLTDSELAYRLGDILKPTLVELTKVSKLSRGLVETLRSAAKVLTLNRRKKESDEAWTKRLISNVEQSVMILSSKPKVGLKKATKKEFRLMAGLAPRMMRSYRVCLKEAIMWDGDLSMVSMFLNDAADHLELGCHLYEGNLRKALNAMHMDTASREEIPATVWNFLQSH